ncbi:hypothetical protein [Myroides sp. LJL119]
MKKSLTLLIISLLTLSCSKSDMGYSNPYLPAVPVNLVIYLNNPEANHLLVPGNIYTTYNHGISGISIYNSGGNQFYAFELTCPNHAIEGMSTLYVKKGDIYATCKDISKHNNKEFTYNLITGFPLDTSKNYHRLKPYPVTLNSPTNPSILTIQY